MIIYPAMDLMGGRCVRLAQGRFDDATVYPTEPADALEAFADEGAAWAHIVDLDGARDAAPRQHDFIAELARNAPLALQVAGGIRTRDQAAACLDAGADKVSINSPAIERPQLIAELAKDFGSQCVVLGIDSFERDGDYYVHQYTGSVGKTRDTGLRTLDWAREATARGAGEIVLNCMRQDGVRTGYDVAHCAAVVDATSVPVIASGGAGAPEHFRDVFNQAKVSGALAATVFHDRIVAIPDLKEFLSSHGIEMRR